MKNSEAKTALVTGAGTGLGRAIAISLAKEGFNVVLTGRREDKLQEVAKEIGNGRTLVLPADVTKEQSVNTLRNDLLEKTGGRLDVLVNNVGGVTSFGPVADMTTDDFTKMIDTNLTSQFLVTKAFIPDLRKSKNGKIISVTSQMSSYLTNGFGPYSASKAGVEALMKTVAEEEKEHGIEVHLFDPGNVLTEGNPRGAQDPMEVIGKVVEMAK